MKCVSDNSKTIANALAELERLRRERDNDTEWLEKYHKTVVGLAALADQYAQSCDAEWLAVQYGLEALAASMKEDLDDRKRGKE